MRTYKPENRSGQVMTIYDVLNDYSLRKNNDCKPSKAYNWTKREHSVLGLIFLGWHKKTKELHFVKSEKADLTGAYI